MDWKRPAVGSGDRTEWPWISLVFPVVETGVRTVSSEHGCLPSYLTSSALAHSSGHRSWSVLILMPKDNRCDAWIGSCWDWFWSGYLEFILTVLSPYLWIF